MQIKDIQIKDIQIKDMQIKDKDKDKDKEPNSSYCHILIQCIYCYKTFKSSYSKHIHVKRFHDKEIKRY